MNLAAPIPSGSLHQHAARGRGLGRSLERLRLQIYLSMMLVDVIVVLGSFVLAGLIYELDPLRRAFVLPAQLLLPIFLTIALYNGTYSLPALRDWRCAVSRVLIALAISGALLNFVAFFAQINRVFSRVGFLIAMVVAVLLFVGTRRLFAVMIAKACGSNPLNVLIIDDGGPPVELHDSYRVIAAEHGLQPMLDDPHSLDRLARYVSNMDQVLVTCPPEKRVQWAMALKGAGVHSEVTSDFMNEIGALGVVRREEAGLTTLLVATGPLGLRSRILKRLFDVVASIGALLAVSPVLLLAALAIKLEDGGPVLFRQPRIGRRNQLFSIYKLRTMTVDGSDTNGDKSTRKGDARITRIGHFLRRTSIDELPQLLNVLRGEMSLVGPRPHAIGSLAGDKLFWQVDQRYWHRHSLRPGLTGLAQVRGLRGATDHESDLSSRLQADLEYLSGWTIWRDVQILFATARVLVHDRAF